MSMTRPISTTAKTTTARRLANNGTSTFNKFAALSEPEPLSMSISNYIPTTTAAPTHTTADHQPAQQTLYIPPWARDVAGSGIGEGKTGVGAGIGGCAGIEGCDCIGGGQTISVQRECVSERIIAQNQNIPCGSESEMSYGVTPSDQVYNDNGSVGLWSDVGKNGKILKLMSGWNPQVVCRCVIKDRSGKSKRTVDSKLARRRSDFIHSDRFSSISVRVSSSVPVVGPSIAPRQEQVVPSSQELGVNCAATGPCMFMHYRVLGIETQMQHFTERKGLLL